MSTPPHAAPGPSRFARPVGPDFGPKGNEAIKVGTRRLSLSGRALAVICAASTAPWVKTCRRERARPRATVDHPGWSALQSRTNPNGH
jgi:hypothetical protein